jgi:hypothetical protein
VRPDGKKINYGRNQDEAVGVHLNPPRHRGACVARPVCHARVALHFLHRQMTGHGHDLVDGLSPPYFSLILSRTAFLIVATASAESHFG